MRKYRFLVATGVALVALVFFLPLAPLAGSEQADSPVTDEEMTMPKIVHMVQPEYPEAARKAGIEGRVLLDVLVRADGTVGKASVTEDEPDVPYYYKPGFVSPFENLQQKVRRNG